jgi:hypothetical protein
VRDPFSNIPRARLNRVTQLLDAPVMALEVRRQKKQIDAQIEQVRELPRGQVTNIVGAVHAGACCNRVAVDCCAESGLMAPRHPPDDAESAIQLALDRFKKCDVD